MYTISYECMVNPHKGQVIFKGLLQVSVFESSNYKKSIVNLTR